MNAFSYVNEIGTHDIHNVNIINSQYTHLATAQMREARQ